MYLSVFNQTSDLILNIQWISSMMDMFWDIRRYDDPMEAISLSAAASRSSYNRPFAVPASDAPARLW